MSPGEPSHTTYSDGVRDGRLQALENQHAEFKERQDKFDRRLTAQERVAFCLLGAIGLLELGPELKALIGG